MAPQKRDTYRYQFKVGNKVVYRGVTSDPKRREVEHRQRWPSGHVSLVGSATGRASALAWERQGGIVAKMAQMSPKSLRPSGKTTSKSGSKPARKSGRKP